MAVDSTQFRSTLAQWTSGVTVVTAAHEGKIYGMTASSFSSVSLTPPLILVCIAKTAHTHQVLMASDGFGVNILSATQTDLGSRFAEKTVEYVNRFADLDVLYGEYGAPLLPDVLAWLDCRKYQAVDAGDHTLFIGEVLTSQVNGGAPLLYANRQWGTFAALE